jgi:hypothetical protein
MSQPSEAPGKTRPRFTERFALLVDRIALRLATSRRVDGLWIGFGGSTRSELVLQRVEEALHLIKKYDLVRYNRLIRDLDRVWVTMLSGPAGCFDRSIAACKLDQRFVLADTSSPEVIASVIVHEAAHARLQRCGIGYEEDLRGRVEAVCIRRQLAFAAKLPNGQHFRDQATQYLERCADRSYWTNTSFSERQLAGDLQALHDLGVPDWLVRTILALRALNLSMRRFVRRLSLRHRTTNRPS